MDMTETILKHQLPKEFSAYYEAKGMKNWVRNSFIPLDDKRTKWITENRFKGEGILRLMLWLMPASFRKQSFRYMKDFKAFAEASQSEQAGPPGTSS
jgi:hypothetical protein